MPCGPRGIKPGLCILYQRDEFVLLGEGKGMALRPATPSKNLSGCGFVMTSHADASPNHSTGNKIRGSRDAANHSSMLPVDNLGIDDFNESFRPITDLNVGSMFVPNKKSSEVQNFGPASSSKATRTAGYNKGPSLVGGFGTESNSLSSFDLEYALLEQALRKDGSAAVASTSSALQAHPEKKAPHNLLEPEFYFSDILGDNGVPPQPLSIKAEDNDVEPSTFQTLAVTTRSGTQEQEVILTHRKCSTTAPLDPDLSQALANLAGSTVSADFRSSKSALTSFKRYPMTFSNVTRDHENADGPSLRRNTSSSRKSSSTNGNPFALRDLQNYGMLGRVAKERHCPSKARHVMIHGENKNITDVGNRFVGNLGNQIDIGCHKTAHSPISDSSMSGIGIGTHPDLYENLSPEIREKVDSLHEKISAMPRRKLRESLSKGVRLEDVEPLMCVNRDELAGMLGLGVTTWKMFVHHTLGIPRWPARALKSQKVKEKKLLQKKLDAEKRGEFEVAEKVERELFRMTQAHMKRRKLFRDDAKLKVNNRPITKI